MVGIYSQKDYADYWAADFLREDAGTTRGDPGTGPLGHPCRLNIGMAEEVPVLRLGVNILVYALTREGSVAQKRASPGRGRPGSSGNRAFRLGRDAMHR